MKVVLEYIVDILYCIMVKFLTNRVTQLVVLGVDYSGRN
jgi:hypothetical protein